MVRPTAGWSGRAALIELLRFCDEQPEAARGLVIESIAWGPAVLLKAQGGSCLELAPSLMSMIAHPYLGAEAGRRELEGSHTHAGLEAAARESKLGFTEPRQAAR